MIAVRVDGLSKQYGSQTAIDHISFQAGKGRILGFLGPNAAGKSTTMKILAGCLSPSSGQATIGGMPVGVSAIDTKRLVGYLTENNPLYIDLYVKESLAYFAGIYRVNQDRKSVV